MGALRLDDVANVAWLLAVQEVVVWLSGLGGRRWRRWLLATVQGDAVVVEVQGEVEAQVGDCPTQGHSVVATVSEGSASL